MPCFNCGCNKSEHQYTRDGGTGGGQCNNHYHCQMYVTKRDKQQQRELFSS